MSEQSTYPKYIYRMIHIENMEYILRTGLCSSLNNHASTNYTAIGDPLLSRDRAGQSVPVSPGGIMPEYAPFYFAGRMPMLASMIYADELLLKHSESLEFGAPPRYGVRATWKVHQQEIVFVVCDFQRVTTDFKQWCFTDGHPSSPKSKFYNSLDQLKEIYWRMVEHGDKYHDKECKRRRQAEFLLKDHIPVSYIERLFVCYPQTQARLEQLMQSVGVSIPIEVDSMRSLFFHEEGKTLGELLPAIPIGGMDIVEADQGAMDRFERQGKLYRMRQERTGNFDACDENLDVEYEQQVMDRLQEQHDAIAQESQD